MRTYELLFIARPELEEEELGALVESIQKAMTDNGGEIVDVEHWGKRTLAYAIKHKTEGYYVLIHAKLELPAIREMERTLKLSEDVLRYLLVRMDEDEEE